MCFTKQDKLSKSAATKFSQLQKRDETNLGRNTPIFFNFFINKKGQDEVLQFIDDTNKL